MATHDYIISNASGAAVRADLNNALAAIVSNNSNATSPATTYAYQWWADTTTGQLKLRNSANSAWITIFELDGTMLMEDGSVSAPGLAFASDLDTGFFKVDPNDLGFATGGVQRLRLSPSEAVFNENSVDYDFRVESNGNTHMLFVDAGNDRIGVGTDSPTNPLHIKASGNQLYLEDSATSNVLQIRHSGGVAEFNSFNGSAARSFVFKQYTSERARIDTSGRLLVGTTSSIESSSVIQAVNASNSTIIIGNTSTSASGEAVINFAPSNSIAGGQIKCIAEEDFSTGANRTAFLQFNTRKDGTFIDAMRIDSSGRLLVGTTTAVGSSNAVIIKGTSGVSNASIYLGNTANASTLVAGNTLGFIEYGAADGGVGAQVLAAADGTWSSTSDCPTRLVFSTSADSSSSPTERLRIDSSGNSIQYSTGTLNRQHRQQSSSVYSATNIRSIISGAAASLAFDTNTNWTNGNAVERVRIDSTGRVLIGTSSDQGGYLFQVKGGDASLTKLVEAAGGNAVQMLRFRVHNINNTAQSASLAGISAETVSSWGGVLTFHTKDANGSPNETLTEQMRIDSNGYLYIGRTSDSDAAGITLFKAGFLRLNRDGSACSVMNRLTSDGNLVEFRQNSITEGTISVSGTTVSYNGGHLARWSQLSAGAARTEILRGSVLSNLDEMCEWAHAAQDAVEAQDAVLYTEEDELPEGVSVGDVKTPAVEASPAVDAYTENNEQLNRMKVSDVEGDVNVAGVFQAWDDDDDTYDNDFYCAMTGDFVIRIAQGTTVARGDLLMSAGDGTAKPQDDDIVRSKTIAKVTSTTVSTTYSDGSYCVPCVLMAC